MTKHYLDASGQWKSERNFALQHRTTMHDYRRPGIYMITLCTNNRHPLFGRLLTPQNTVEPTPIGQLVLQEWQQLSVHTPSISILDYQLMPDHLHGILKVEAPLDRPLGHIIRSFKMRCTSLYRALMHDDSPLPMPQEGKASLSITQRRQVATRSLWSPNYNDRIAHTHRRLETLRAYIHDNPRRLALKKQHPEYFALMRDLTIPISDALLHFTAMGNRELLKAQHKQVIQCSRALTNGLHEEEYRALKHDKTTLASSGYVSVSAAISKGEQQICRSIREQGFPLIILMKDGFPAPVDPHSKYYKPGGVLFEACAKGQLLLLEPTIDCFEIPDVADAVYRKSPMASPDSDRYRFLALNKMADLLVSKI